MAALPPVPPYACNIQCTDDETFEFSVPWSLVVDAFDFDANDIEYSIKFGDVVIFSATTADDGIVVAGDRVTFAVPDGTFLNGRWYVHGCRTHHIATGKRTTVFTGSIAVSDGAF